MEQNSSKRSNLDSQQHNLKPIQDKSHLTLKTLDDVSFSRTLLKIVAIPITFIVMSMTISHLQFQYRDKLRDRLEVLSDLELLSLSLMKYATEMEMSQKGYSLTGNMDFLNIYQESYKKMSLAEEKVFNITLENPDLRLKFRALTKSINHWQSNLYLISKQVSSAPQFNKDLIRFDKIRDNHTDFTNEILEIKAQTQKNYTFSTYLMYSIEVLCAFFLAIFIYFLLKKQIYSMTLSYSKLIEENQTYVKNLEEASKSKDLFLANMSHEIRTPLGAVIGFADLLSEDTSLKPQSRNQINFIKRNANHLLGLVEDLFDLSKVATKKMEVYFEQVLLLPLLNDLKNNFSAFSNDKNIEFKIHILNNIPQEILTDPKRLKQILINLIGNAIKFSEKNSSVLLNVSHKDGHLNFDVKDSGIGIEEKEQKHIFDSFHQADINHSRKYSGAGLGLSIAKNFAELLNGQVKLVSSKQGFGSHFQLSLPVEAQEITITQDDMDTYFVKPNEKQEIIGTIRQFPTLNPLLLDNVNILLAEDSKENQILYKTYLESVRANVEVANNGSEAVRKALTNNFDIILMDIQMPNVDGYEAMKILKDSAYDKKIIALTAHALKDEKDKCLKMGFDGYISKPVTKNNLVTMIKFHLKQNVQLA